jgi:hypothetical protein
MGVEVGFEAKGGGAPDRTRGRGGRDGPEHLEVR